MDRYVMTMNPVAFEHFPGVPRGTRGKFKCRLSFLVIIIIIIIF